MRHVAAGTFVLAIALTIGCGGGTRYRTVTYPPRIDLSQHEMIGVVEFADSSDGEMGSVATRRFTESARRDQGLVRMVWLDGEDGRPDPQRLRKLGSENGVQTLLLGQLRLAEVKPNVSISPTLSSGSLSASVEATLDVEMVEASTGASLWSASATTRRQVGSLSVLAGKMLSFDAKDPENVYGQMIDELVSQVTGDFHNTWGREPIP